MPPAKDCNRYLDPQQGDQFRGDGHTRHVLKRDGAMLLISCAKTRYWMRVDRWQKWCQQSEAVVRVRSRSRCSHPGLGHMEHSCEALAG
jgi:hypothetical protein